MRRSLGFLTLLTVTLVLFAADPAAARKKPLEIKKEISPSLSLDRGVIERPLRSVAADTTVIAEWDFEGCSPQGWVSVDLTVQTGDYIHVDDFAGMSPPYAPLEGTQSLWCGARPSTSVLNLCGYAALPGYGSSWNQAFQTVDCVAVTGDVTIEYLIAYDVEPDYDYVYLEWDTCGGEWNTLWAGTDVRSPTLLSNGIAAIDHDGDVRIRFRFESDPSWDDADGLWDTDGAFILDALSVSDTSGTVLPTELFEVEALGAHETVSGNWETYLEPGYGDFAGLYPAGALPQDGYNECDVRSSCVWAFFNGSTADYSCGGYPGVPAVPYENERGQYISNEVWSPLISTVGVGPNAQIEIEAYHDLNFTTKNVFYQWHVRSWVDGCPSLWYTGGSVIFFPYLGWHRHIHNIGNDIDPAASHFQVAVGAVDLEPIYGVGNPCHTPAPLIDKVRITNPSGIQWFVRSIDLFQDNFSSDGTTTGVVRADIAEDILPSANPNIRPGDSCVVAVTDLDGSLAADPHTGFGSAVYAYVSVWPQGQVGKSGDALTSDSFRYPVVDSLVHDGDTWYCLRMDTSFTDGAARRGAQPDHFCVDLNDNLFTPGDTVCFVFAAEAAAPSFEESYYTEFTGMTNDPWLAFSNPSEFMCLPTPPKAVPYRVLYVDGADGRGAQPAFDAAFDALGISGQVDRFDVRGPTAGVASNPGSRVVSPLYQVARVYDIIVWSTGDVYDEMTLGDGLVSNKKGDDASLMATFIDDRCLGGVYFTGDNIAEGISDAGGAGGAALRSFITFTLDGSDHVAQGHDVSPLVLAEPGSCFDHSPGDSLVAHGDCPIRNQFDVISPAGSATLEASYHSGATTGGAVVAQQQQNPNCAWTGSPQRHGVILAGFGFENIQNDRPSTPSDAVTHMGDVIAWLLDVPTNVRPSTLPGRNALEQNIPNPFNPATTIRFQVRERGRVTIDVYNVAGQLVRTLLDEVRSPGAVHVAEWDGTDDRGQTVASGVYFYRMVTKGFSGTRKMVLLK